MNGAMDTSLCYEAKPMKNTILYIKKNTGKGNVFSCQTERKWECPFCFLLYQYKLLILLSIPIVITCHYHHSIELNILYFWEAGVYTKLYNAERDFAEFTGQLIASGF